MCVCSVSLVCVCSVCLQFICSVCLQCVSVVCVCIVCLQCVCSELEFCLCGWMKNEVCERKVDTRDELLARILDFAACVKKREDQLRRTTRELRTGIAKCTEDDGEVFRIYILNCKKVIQTLNYN